MIEGGEKHNCIHSEGDGDVGIDGDGVGDADSDADIDGDAAVTRGHASQRFR